MSLFSRKKFTFRRQARSEIPEGLWMKCDGCHQTVYRAEVEEHMKVCPLCGYHYRVDAWTRVTITVDADSFQETHGDLETGDPLHFSVGGESYVERIDRAKIASSLNEALLTGRARIEGHPVALGVMDPDFVMGSMGSVVGEKFCRLVEDAIADALPLVVFCASGGARMQEGILALMQMAKTADAICAFQETARPFLSVLTDPVTGGVWASFASLGDIIIAEPGAYIGFAGKRLIEGALNVKLPEGFQSAEYQMRNGFVDMIVKRQDIRRRLGKLVAYLTPDGENSANSDDVYASGE